MRRELLGAILRGLRPIAGVCLVASACATDPDTAKRQFLASGDDFASQGKHREAIVQYLNAIQRDPSFAEAHYRLAEAYVAVEEPHRALPEYIIAADLRPDDLDAQLRAGNLLLLAGEFDDVQARARTVLRRDPTNALALVLLGNGLAGMKSLDEAIAANQKAIALDPTRAESYTNIGALHLVQGNRAEAMAAFQEAIKLAPRSAHAHLALANYYWAVGEFSSAEQTVKQALEVEPTNVAANQALAWSYVMMGNPRAAEPYFKAAARLENTTASTIALADYYIASSRREDALAVLQPVAEVSASFAFAKTRMALAEFALGSREAAFSHIQDVLTRDPTNAVALAFQTHLFLAERRIDEALSAAKAAVGADPLLDQAHFALGRASLGAGAIEAGRLALNEVLKLNNGSVEARLDLARLHLSRNEIQTAHQFAQEAATMNPRSLDAQLMLLQTLSVRQDDTVRADAQMRRILSNHPRSPEAHIAHGNLLLSRNDRASARRAYQRALEINPTTPDALAQLLALDIQERRTRDARDRIEAALARNPTSPTLMLITAETYAASGDLARSESLLRQIIARDASSLHAYTALATLYLNQRKSESARAEFMEVARRAPDSIQSRTMIGLLFDYEGNSAEAERWYSEAVRIDRRAAVAGNNLAWIYAERGSNLDYALDLALNAIASLPDSLEVADTLAWVHYKRNIPTLAMPLLERCVTLAPSNPIYVFHLGMAYARLGQDAKARIALEKALTLNPTFPGAEDARKALASLAY